LDFRPLFVLDQCWADTLIFGVAVQRTNNTTASRAQTFAAASRSILHKNPLVGSCELGGNEFEVAFDRGKAGSGLIGLPQR
jgi:hypothetical protein